MRTIIAGSRGVTDYAEVEKALSGCKWTPTVVISGTARGADALGEMWASEHGVPVEKYPADWDKYGKSAGYKRNELMASKAEACVVLWDGASKGSQHMIDLAQKYRLRLYVHHVTIGK